MLLALDTSTRQAGIALYDSARGLLAEFTWQSANRHTEELVPAIAHMLAQAGVSGRDLNAIGVALGPGSFTGLRVGLAAAKGLALVHGLTLIGVPTLEFTAYPQRFQPLPVTALVQAGRGRVFWAAYAHGTGGWTAQEPAALATAAEIAARIADAGWAARPTLFVGEVSPADRETLAQCAGKGCTHFLPPALAMRRPGYLAELAWQRYLNGEADDVASLSPIYAQQPDGAQPAKV